MPARKCECYEGIRGRLYRGLTIKALLGNLVKIAVFAAVAYGAWILYQQQSGSGGSEAYAQRECVDAINSRYDLAGVKAFEATENRNGFTVRASGARQDGTRVRIVCLTSPNGTVRDISLEHR